MDISRTAIAAMTALWIVGPLHAQDTPSVVTIGILLAAGDIGNCGNENWQKVDDETAAVIQRQIDNVKAKTPHIPVRVLVLGDLAYPTGKKEDFDCFHASWGRFKDLMLPVPGNHEYKATNPNGKPYFDYFKDKSLVTENGEMTGYYAVNFPDDDGPWRLIGLNAYVGGTAEGLKEDKKRSAARKAQLDWLETKLDININNGANKQPCVLAFWHPPIFSSGKHGHGDKTDPAAALTQGNMMRDAFLKLYGHGASVVLAGHDHDYEQFSKHDVDGNARNDGIRSFVIGTGGTNLTQIEYNKHARNSEGIYSVHGVLQIELSRDGYKWDFLPIDSEKHKKPKLKSTEDRCNVRR